MLNKIPLRLRITLVSTLLLILCCLGLTVMLNIAANNMADVIEAAPLTPAKSIEHGNAASSPPMMAGAVSSKASLEARQIFLFQSVGYMIAIVVTGGVFTWLLTGKAMTQLRELSNQIKNRTVHNLSEVLPVSESRDEVAALTVSFNEMSTKLEEAFVTQKRFSQSAAHELRTPLTVLKTKLDVFRKKPIRTQEEYDALLCSFETQTDRLSGLVSELLNLTSMDALECNEEIAIAPMLTEIIEELGCQAAKREVTVTLTCDALTVNGNSSLLNRAIYNLVENAIKYNRRDGTVLLAAKQDNGKTHISVTDTGLGIADEQKPLIFEPFYRVDRSRSRKLGGTGLGLSTVKAIIDKHGGEIVVTDNPAGGSVFTVILKKRKIKDKIRSYPSDQDISED